MALRLDKISALSGPKRLDDGRLRVPARLTRTGVFPYRQADGTIRRELRHPDDVFHPDALESLKGVPVVVGHPAMLDAKNWPALAKGDVRDDVTKDDRYVAATLAINDAETVKDIGKKLVELSCGYFADVIPESGTYDGEPYDARQTNIRYNHVGLGPKDWGRAGNEVRVHLDAQDAAEEIDAPTPNHISPAGHYPTRMDLDTALKALGAANEKLAQKDKEIETANARADKAEARADKAEAKLDAAESTLDARVAARIALEARAKELAPKFDCKGKSDAEVKRAIVALHTPKDLTGKSDVYMDAAFDLLDVKVEDADRKAVRSDAIETIEDSADPLAAAQKKGLPSVYGKSDSAIVKGSN